MQAANELRQRDEEERLRAQEAARAAELQAAAERQIERARQVRIQEAAEQERLRAEEERRRVEEAADAAQLQAAAERQSRFAVEGSPLFGGQPPPAAFAEEFRPGPSLEQRQASAMNQLRNYLNDVPIDWGSAEKMIRRAPVDLRPALQQELSMRFEQYRVNNEDTNQQSVEDAAVIIAPQSTQAARYLDQLEIP